MEPETSALPDKTLAPQPRLSADRFASIAWSSAVSSVGRAFTIMLLGELGWSIAGSIWDEMVPVGQHDGGVVLPHLKGFGKGLGFSGHWFAILWVLSFVTLSTYRLAAYLPDARHRKFIRWFRRIDRGVAKNWIRWTVRNALVALGTAIGVYYASQFTWSALLWREVIEPILAPILHGLLSIFGAGDGSTVQALFDWYGENQFRLTYWSVYFGLIADDLGLPGIKTIVRFLWERIGGRLGFAGVQRASDPSTRETGR